MEKNNAHREAKNHVCEDYISGLKSQIKNVTDFDISERKVKELIATSSLERIMYHLENWYIHKKNQVKSGAGYFITVIANNIESVEPENKNYNQDKIPQRDNFEQREYTDEQLESLYANFSRSLEV